MGVKNNHNHKFDDRIIKFEAFTLSVVLSVLLCFSLFITIRNAVAGSVFSDLPYLISAVLAFLLLVLNLKGYYKAVAVGSAVFFTLLVFFRFIIGPLRELNVIYFAIIIVGTLYLTEERFAYSLIASIFLFITVHFFLTKETENFSSDYLLFTLLTLFLITLFCILNMQVLKMYIKRISKSRDELEKEVFLRTEDLNKSKEYAELLFHKSPCAIYTTDIDNNVVDFNKKAESITGYSENEVVGKPFNIYCAESCTYGKHCNEKNSSSNECKMITKEGETKIIERYSSRLHDKNGLIIGNIESFIDLTEWRELEDFKIDIERIIRHDLKTPLNSIIGFPQMMLDDEAISEENKQYLQIVLNSGKIMRNLIESSQYLYKLEKKIFTVSKADIEIFSVIKQIDMDLLEIKEKKNCNVLVYYNDTITDGRSEFHLSTDKTLLYMILSNLIKNALEASPENGEITVGVNSGNNLKITVHNKGVIPLEIRESFFNKYVTMNKKSGTGLGTYSARIMADALGADLSFETDEEKGTYLFMVFNSR